MRIEELFSGIPLEGNCPTGEIGEIRSDSRRVGQGDLFVCLRGRRRDGHESAREALAKGAAYILGEHPIEGVPREKMLVTENTRRAESRLWNNKTGRPTDGMLKIAVTGTAGKTTVALLLDEIFRTAGIKTGVITTVRCDAGGIPISMGENGGSSVSDIPGAMTTPDPEYFFGAAEEMKKAGCEVFLWEASSQSLALEKTSAITPDLAVFTNLTPEHLDFHGTMEEYFRAKASLLRGVPKAVYNGEDGWLRKLPALHPETEFVSCRTDAAFPSIRDVCAKRIRSLGADGMDYFLLSRRAAFRVKTPMPGLYSVKNSLLACAAALSAGIDASVIKDAVAGFSGVDGRMLRVSSPGSAGPKVFIDYAHTPEEMEAVLKTVREFSGGHLTAVFGCGGERDRSKRPRMAKTAETYADEIVVTADNPRGEDPDAIFRDILAGFDGGKPISVIPDRARAIRYAITSAPEDGVVVLLGKGHEKYEITARGKVLFDEESIAKDALKARRQKG